MPAAEVASRPNRDDTGWVSLAETVRGSTARMDSIGAFGFLTPEKLAAFTAFDSNRVQLATMSSASTLRPLTGGTLCQLAFWRSLNVTCSLSGLNSQESTRSPTYSVPGGWSSPGLSRISRENTMLVGTPAFPR